jgi:hypothetical protein
MSLNVATPIKPVRMSVWDYALLAYVEKTANADGTFQQTAAKIAETLAAEERSIQRHLRDLVNAGRLAELEPRRRDAHGLWIPAVYRLIPATIGTGGLTSNEYQRQSAQVDTPYVPNDAGQSKGVNLKPATNDALESNTNRISKESTLHITECVEKPNPATIGTGGSPRCGVTYCSFAVTSTGYCQKHSRLISIL